MQYLPVFQNTRTPDSRFFFGISFVLAYYASPASSILKILFSTPVRHFGLLITTIFKRIPPFLWFHTHDAYCNDQHRKHPYQEAGRKHAGGQNAQSKRPRDADYVFTVLAHLLKHPCYQYSPLFRFGDKQKRLDCSAIKPFFVPLL